MRTQSVKDHSLYRAEAVLDDSQLMKLQLVI